MFWTFGNMKWPSLNKDYKNVLNTLTKTASCIIIKKSDIQKFEMIICSKLSVGVLSVGNNMSVAVVWKNVSSMCISCNLYLDVRKHSDCRLSTIILFKNCQMWYKRFVSTWTAPTPYISVFGIDIFAVIFWLLCLHCVHWNRILLLHSINLNKRQNHADV